MTLQLHLISMCPQHSFAFLLILRKKSFNCAPSTHQTRVYVASAIRHQDLQPSHLLLFCCFSWNLWHHAARRRKLIFKSADWLMPIMSETSFTKIVEQTNETWSNCFTKFMMPSFLIFHKKGILFDALPSCKSLINLLLRSLSLVTHLCTFFLNLSFLLFYVHPLEGWLSKNKCNNKVRNE